MLSLSTVREFYEPGVIETTYERVFGEKYTELNQMKGSK